MPRVHRTDCDPQNRHTERMHELGADLSAAAAQKRWPSFYPGQYDAPLRSLAEKQATSPTRSDRMNPSFRRATSWPTKETHPTRFPPRGATPYLPGQMHADVMHPRLPRDESFVDDVDGDEPGHGVIDEQLERLSQPHVVAAAPRFPRFAEQQVRMRTFNGWRNPFPCITLLVLSGFFYLGGRDSVQCFYCAIILHSWDESDIPDEEHRRHSPQCHFLRQKLQADSERYAAGRRLSPAQPGQDVQLASAYDRSYYQRGEAAPGPLGSSRDQSPSSSQERIVRIVAGMGHSMDAIEKAMEQLRLSGQHKFDTSTLVDAVFEVEDKEDLESLRRNTALDTDSGSGTSSPSRPARSEGGAAAPVLIRPHGTQQVIPPTAPAAAAAAEVVVENNLIPSVDSLQIQEKAKALEKENETLRKQTTCRVCFENPATEVFLPCGHLACCQSCTERLSECPYCRKKIVRVVHVYLP